MFHEVTAQRRSIYDSYVILFVSENNKFSAIKFIHPLHPSVIDWNRRMARKQSKIPYNMFVSICHNPNKKSLQIGSPLCSSVFIPLHSVSFLKSIIYSRNKLSPCIHMMPSFKFISTAILCQRVHNYKNRINFWELILNRIYGASKKCSNTFTISDNWKSCVHLLQITVILCVIKVSFKIRQYKLCCYGFWNNFS